MSEKSATQESAKKTPEKIDAKISDRICRHMNKDHAEAVLTYAQRYGNQTEATAATLMAIDPIGMDITAEVNGQPLPLRIPFDHKLKDAADAHTTLVDMLRS